MLSESSFPRGGDLDQEPPQTPIDGWVAFMLVLAVGLVFYVAYKKKEAKS